MGNPPITTGALERSGDKGLMSASELFVPRSCESKTQLLEEMQHHIFNYLQWIW
jgi:hypothetical protein